MKEKPISKFISTTEIKYRGLLTSTHITRLVNFLNRHAVLVNKGHEHALYFESTAFPSIGDFSWGVARLSLKKMKQYVSLRLKEGNAAAYKRKEFEVKVPISQARNLLYILYRLGLKEGFYRPSFRSEYRYGNLIIVMKEKCVMGDHFEISLKDDTPKSRTEASSFIKKFQLRCWSESQYKHRITRRMKTAPAVNIFDVPI